MTTKTSPTWVKLSNMAPGGYQPATKQQGLAAIMVILIIALVTVLVTGLFNQQSLDIRRTGNILGQDQSTLYSLAAETFARAILKNDWANDKKENSLIDHELDTNDEQWGQYAIQIPVDTNIGIQGQIDDLTAKFNINSIVTNKGEASIVNKTAVARLQRLLNNLEEINPDLVAEKFVDWIDRDDQVYEIKGAEDETYLLADTPYRTANTLFNDISELWLIDGMTQQSFQELKGILSVLPNSNSTINVNTATAKVFRAYIPALTEEEAEEIIAARENAKGFKKLDEFLKLDALAGKKGIPAKEFTLSTEYFQILIKAVFNDRVTRLTSTIYRDSEGNTSVLKRNYASREEISKQVYISEKVE
jgi:general secretion pathway protein K